MQNNQLTLNLEFLADFESVKICLDFPKVYCPKVAAARIWEWKL